MKKLLILTVFVLGNSELPGWAIAAITNAFKINKDASFPEYVIESYVDECSVPNSLLSSWIINNLSKYKFCGFSLNLIPVNVIYQWLKSFYIFPLFKRNFQSWDRLTLFSREIIPISGPISVVISNFILNGLESYLLDDANIREGHLNSIQNGFLYFVRCYENMIILCSRFDQTLLVLERLKKFLFERGIFYSMKNSFIRILPNENFDFVGFRFKLVCFRNKFKLYRYPSSDKVTKLMRRVLNVFKKYNQIQNKERCFIKLNLILNSWLNFYRIGNSQKIFRKISKLLWDYTNSYFKKLYLMLPEFRKKKVYKRKSRIMRYIFKNHIKNYGSFKNWWFINALDLTVNDTKKTKDLFLICPSQVSISAPRVLVYRNRDNFEGLNAFHPLDRLKLSNCALTWKFGLERKVLLENLGYCSECSWLLLAEDDFVDFYKVINYFSGFKILRFRPFCLLCFKRIVATLGSFNASEIQGLKKIIRKS